MISTGYNWYVDEYGIFYIKSKPTTATHTFVFGRHFSEVKVERSMEKVRNALLFWNTKIDADQIFKLYSDATSIGRYGRRVEKVSIKGVDDETTADQIGLRFINDNKEPSVKVVCTIVDDNEVVSTRYEGYDIETIQPGDTCNFKGFDEEFADIFNENMLITKVAYSPDKVELTIEVQKAGIIDWQSQTSKKVEEINSNGSPEIYTV